MWLRAQKVIVSQTAVKRAIFNGCQTEVHIVHKVKLENIVIFNSDDVLSVEEEKIETEDGSPISFVQFRNDSLTAFNILGTIDQLIDINFINSVADKKE